MNKAPITATFELDILFTFVTYLILREAPIIFLSVTLVIQLEYMH